MTRDTWLAALWTQVPTAPWEKGFAGLFCSLSASLAVGHGLPVPHDCCSLGGLRSPSPEALWLQSPSTVTSPGPAPSPTSVTWLVDGTAACVAVHEELNATQKGPRPLWQCLH